MLTANHGPHLFHWHHGLKLTTADLAIDFRRRQPRAFISHAHGDHLARHEYALCTPETAALYQLRLGPRPTLELPYRTPIDWAGLNLTTYPAGHCLGSAMLLAEDRGQTLLYTGDFKLGPSATSPLAELPHADILVMECTFGDPAYCLPPREEVLAEFFALVRKALADGAVPVVLAYILGKGQEVTRLLTAEGIPVLQHPKIYEVSRVYESFGVELGRHARLAASPSSDERRPQPWRSGEEGVEKPSPDAGWAVVVPPGTPLEHFPRQVRFALTGWALDPRTKYRLGVDHALPLSDHADYNELLEAIRRVAPRVIYCTHGPESFADRLLDLGYNAQVLGRARQKRLF
jgi:putative mRNA 3-end processing factor